MSTFLLTTTTIQDQPVSGGAKNAIETALAWATVAYAAGFVTILAHTARLGLPVLELVKPVYIWIGAPFAVVFFFTRHLWRLIQSRVLEFGTELTNIRSAATATPDAKTKRILELLLDIGSTSLVGLLIPAKEVIVIARALSDRIVAAVQQSTSIRRAVAISNVVLVFVLIIREISRIVTFVFLIGLIPFGLWLYVWVLYPLVPQSLGGGKPTPVVLILDKDKTAAAALDVLLVKDTAKRADSVKTVVSKPVDLLYSTKDEIHIAAPDNRVISLARTAINGTIWVGKRKKS